MSKIIEIYTDGACSGNPGLYAPEAAELRGRVGSCGFAASSRLTRPRMIRERFFNV
ncbi:MAG: hypothetical protein ACRBDI_09040 [Alphaproteobacteria bacterium]